MSIPHQLDPGVVTVLQASLQSPPWPEDQLTQMVTAAERARAARYHQPADALRHLIGRAVARAALSRLMGLAPLDVPIALSSYGKPSVPNGPSFNVAHSGDVVLVALAREGRLGVDVEAIRTLDDLDGVAASSFVVAERAELPSSSEEARLRHFYRIWARKEAMLKALGIGIGALSSLQVSGSEAVANALLKISLSGEHADQWTIRPMQCGPAVEAAVAWDQPLSAVSLIPLP